MAKKRIAIVNRTNLKNYGSVLQVYALCYTVKKMGYDSVVVWQSGNLSKNFDIRPIKLIRTLIKLLCHPSLIISFIKTLKWLKSTKIDEDKVQKFDEFVRENYNQILYSQEELIKVSKTDTYYRFVCGSDQIWCSTTLYPDPMMYLRFAPYSKRIAYAPSIGRDYIPSYNKRTLKKYISEIPCVSIREDVGQRLINELTGKVVPVVADPTLLMSTSEWDNLKLEIEIPDKYILCYFLDTPSDAVTNAIIDLASKCKCDVVVLGEMGTITCDSFQTHRPTAGPGEFLFLVSKAWMVITDSYHGMLFSINYNKKFWAVERAYAQYDQSSRQHSVLSRLGLRDRYLTNKYNFNDEEIDYSIVQSKIDAFVSDSLEYLRNAIK